MIVKFIKINFYKFTLIFFLVQLMDVFLANTTT